VRWPSMKWVICAVMGVLECTRRSDLVTRIS
jgi:hypothetical protein